MTQPLSDAEGRAAEAAWAGASRAPVAQRLQGVGCLAAFLGMAALTLTPAVGAFTPLEPGVAGVILMASVGLLVAGAVAGLVGAGWGAKGSEPAIDDAIVAVVSAWEAGSPTAVEAAAVLLARLRAAPPAASPDPAETARRLGPALPVVRRVQGHLIARGLLPPP